MKFLIENGILKEVRLDDKAENEYITSSELKALVTERMKKGRRVKEEKELVIPDTVTCIADDLKFSRLRDLTKITIPKSVVSIGKDTFGRGCTNLTYIDVATDNPCFKSVNGVLFNRDMTTLIKVPQKYADKSYEIPEGVTHIGEVAFYDCWNLTDIILPESVISIGKDAFTHCDELVGINIPKNVTEIANGVFTIFRYSPFVDIELAFINVDSDNPNFASENGVLFNHDKTKLLRYPPKHPNKTYNIPESVKCIDKGAFAFCGNLDSITIPESVTHIGERAFFFCFEATYDKELGDFTYSGLTSISIPKSVTSIGHMAFMDTLLTDITIPTSVASIGYGAFMSSELKSILIPGSIVNIESCAFAYCNDLIDVIISEGVADIGENSFSDCNSLKNVSIPESVTNIGRGAFACCKNLVSFVIPKNVTSIGEVAFAHCEELVSVSIPASVTAIGEDAFGLCNKLVIHAPKGSFAEKYALENNIPFTATTCISS